MLFTAQDCARLRTGLIITQIPRCYQKKKVYCVEMRDMCNPLRKNPFLAFQKFKQGVVHCARLRTGPIIMQIPRGYQKKMFIVYKDCDFVDKLGISVLRGVGWVPQKSAGFGATAPAQKHPRSRCGTKKHSI